MPFTKPVIMLVHGAWHGSWCWKFQTPELEARGYTVKTLDLPCTSGVAGKTQFSDAAHVRAELETLVAEGKQVVVLAHSYAGPIACSAIIGLSCKDRAATKLPGGVLAFVALCAYIFPGGMDQGAVIRSIPGGLPYVVWDSPSEGLFLPKNPQSLFYPPDVSADRTEWAVSQLRPQSMAANVGIVPPQAWQGDTYEGRLGYVRCTSDCVIPLADQDAMIEAGGGSARWNIRSLEGSSHSPFLSRPDQLAAERNSRQPKTDLESLSYLSNAATRRNGKIQPDKWDWIGKSRLNGAKNFYWEPHALVSITSRSTSLLLEAR